MLQAKSMRYKKVYTELDQIINILSKEEKKKIPNELIENIKLSMDKEYKWEYETSKSLLEQKLMPETKALIVEIYERYLCPENEKKFWKKYDKICFDNIEKQKKKLYKNENIFK